MFWTPLLIGAGVGALGGLLTGNDPLKTAALGAAIGGTGGAAGAWGGGAATAAGTSTGLATGAGSAAGGTGIALGDVAASSTLPTMLQGSNLASGIGAGTGIGGATGTGVQLANAGTGLYGFDPVSAAQGGAGISNLGQYATGAGTDIMAATPTMWDEISPYMNVRDLTGAGLVAAQYQQRPQMPTAPSGGISRGQAPQGTDVMALLSSVKPREQRRISLL
jgi:hypothetical protein